MALGMMYTLDNTLLQSHHGVCVNALVIFNAFEVIFTACSRHNAYVITGIPIITLANISSKQQPCNTCLIKSGAEFE